MIILVGGAKSSSGKTTFIRLLLKVAPDKFTVIKVTPSDKLEDKVETDISVLSEKGKDTALFLDGGAKSVIWVHGKRSHIKELLKEALKISKEPAIVEGNSAAQYINNGVLFFVKRENEQIAKESSKYFLKKANYIVINSGSEESTIISGNKIRANLLKELKSPSKALQSFIINLTKNK